MRFCLTIIHTQFVREFYKCNYNINSHTIKKVGKETHRLRIKTYMYLIHQDSTGCQKFIRMVIL